MRFLASLLVLVPSFAMADRYFHVPTGRKLPFETYRVELAENPYHRGTLEKSLTLGIGKSFETEVRFQNLNGIKAATALDLSFNMLGPIPDLAPGISFGIQDLADETPDRRRAYAAMTYRKVFSGLNGDATGDLTIGMFVGRKSGPYLGMAIPFSQEFRFIFEHDLEKISAGFEYRPFTPIAFRMYLRERNRLVSVAWTGKY